MARYLPARRGAPVAGHQHCPCLRRRHRPQELLCRPGGGARLCEDLLSSQAAAALGQGPLRAALAQGARSSSRLFQPCCTFPRTFFFPPLAEIDCFMICCCSKSFGTNLPTQNVDPSASRVFPVKCVCLRGHLGTPRPLAPSSKVLPPPQSGFSRAGGKRASPSSDGMVCI